MFGFFKKELRILSIDGGGIRGLIPATILAKIEESLNEPIWKYFDLICGTSTGGILALALSVEKPMKKVRELYDSKAGEIFPPTSKFMMFNKMILGEGGRYDSESLENALKEEFKKEDNDYLKMKDAKTRLCIPAFDITNGEIAVYKTPHKVKKPEQKELISDADKYMWEVARATSAAPTFFKSTKVEESYYVDGGIWANNPSLVGILEAIRLGIKIENIKLLSLGTGFNAFHTEDEKAKKMNLFNWGVLGFLELPFIRSNVIHTEVSYLVDPKKYMRVQYKFAKQVSMDDITVLDDLKSAADELYSTFGAEIKSKFFDSISKYPPYPSE